MAAQHGDFHHLFYACSHDISPVNYDVRFVPRADIARDELFYLVLRNDAIRQPRRPFYAPWSEGVETSDRSNKTLETKIRQGELKGLRGGALVVHISQI